MRRLLATLTLLCVPILGAVAAPAVSTRSWRPAPSDFSLAPPPTALLGDPSARGPGVVSAPLRAPKRFNLVGLTWADAGQEPGVAVRTRTDGDGWSRWATLYAHSEDGPDPGAEPAARGASAPTWVGEADWVQYRVSRLPRGLRLHFVNVRGTATAGDRARTAIRRVASAGVASLAGIARAAGAHAAEPAPEIVPRSAWGAADCPPRRAPDYGEVRAAFIHHTVNSNDYTREEAPYVVLGVCRFHRNTNGWNDIGYNFLVDRFGTIYEGRAGGLDQAVAGAQAQGYNSQSTGIANMGTFTSVPQSPEALSAIARLIRWKLPLHGAPTAGTTTLTSAGGSGNRFPAGRQVQLPRVIGHRDAGATSCPGDALYSQLPELRRLVGDVAPTGVATSLVAQADARTVPFGGTVAVTGTLALGGGPPPPGQPVEVQALIGSRWRTVARTSTDERGGLAATVRPMRNRSLRVRYAGAGELRPATSPTFAVGVRPVLSVRGAPRRAGAGMRVAVRGRVTPRKARVHQVLLERRGRRFRKVGTRVIRTRSDGRFEGFFVPARAGAYRFYLVALADSKTVRAATPTFPVRVVAARGGGAVAP